MLCLCGAFWLPRSSVFSSKGVTQSKSAVLLPCEDRHGPGPPSPFWAVWQSVRTSLRPTVSFLNGLPEFLSRLNLCFRDHSGCTPSYLLTAVCWVRRSPKASFLSYVCFAVYFKKPAHLWPHFLQRPRGVSISTLIFLNALGDRFCSLTINLLSRGRPNQQPHSLNTVWHLLCDLSIELLQTL